MYWIYVQVFGVIISLIIFMSIFRDDKEFPNFMRFLISGVFYMFYLLVTVAIFSGIYELNKKEELVPFKYNLGALVNKVEKKSTANGSVFLFIGGYSSVSESIDYYQYMINTVDGLKMEKVRANGNVFIKEVDDVNFVPFVEQYRTVYKIDGYVTNFCHRQDVSVKVGGVEKQIFYLPKGSVLREYSVDLNK